MSVRFIVPFRLAGVEVDIDAVLSQNTSDPGLGTTDLDSERRSPSGASAFDGIVHHCEVEHDGVNATLYIGRLGVGALCFDRSCKEAADIPAQERTCLRVCTELLQASASGWSAQFFPASEPAMASPLWVHRIAVNSAISESILALEYGVKGSLSRGAEFVVADGFSSLSGARPDHLRSFTNGLFVATQTWIANEQVSADLVRLLRAARKSSRIERDMRAQSRVATEIADIALKARELGGYLQRQRRGLVDGEGRVFDAALDSWGIASDVRDLIDRCDTYVNYISNRLDQYRVSAERRRNALLFGLSLTAAGQLVVSLYDFVTGTSTVMGPSPRPALFWTATALAVLGIAVGVVYAGIDVRRSRPHESKL